MCVTIACGSPSLNTCQQKCEPLKNLTSIKDKAYICSCFDNYEPDGNTGKCKIIKNGKDCDKKCKTNEYCDSSNKCQCNGFLYNGTDCVEGMSIYI